MPPQSIPRYYGQPALVGPMGVARPARSDNRALVSLLAGLLGLLLSFLGLPGLVLGPIAYFLGKSSIRRIDESKGELGGRSTAMAGWVMGVVATALGALASLIALTWFLVQAYGLPPT